MHGMLSLDRSARSQSAISLYLVTAIFVFIRLSRLSDFVLLQHMVLSSRMESDTSSSSDVETEEIVSADVDVASEQLDAQALELREKFESQLLGRRYDSYAEFKGSWKQFSKVRSFR